MLCQSAVPAQDAARAAGRVRLPSDARHRFRRLRRPVAAGSSACRVFPPRLRCSGPAGTRRRGRPLQPVKKGWRSVREGQRLVAAARRLSAARAVPARARLHRWHRLRKLWIQAVTCCAPFLSVAGAGCESANPHWLCDPHLPRMLKIATPLAYRCHLARSCGSAMCTIGSKARSFQRTQNHQAESSPADIKIWLTK